VVWLQRALGQSAHQKKAYRKDRELWRDRELVPVHFFRSAIDRSRLDRRGKMAAERLIGTVWRECLDRILLFDESQLRRVLASYAAYYNQARTHLALQKDAPLRRAVQRSGVIVAIPILAGLHHQYVLI
jgi:hypothetical protein